MTSLLSCRDYEQLLATMLHPRVGPLVGFLVQVDNNFCYDTVRGS